MALSAGERLGPYEIRELLGAGGMGEVYRARDSKLGRDVAIKVLPEEFSQDSKRLARFKREAQLLAALNHPNIAAIHGLEESGATLYLVLELVPGETLAARLSKGRLTVEEALRIATQVAEALEEAHEKGIIHRDLKPGNIMITEDGKVKVLDFGLARAFAEDTPEADSSLSPTLTRDGTRAGVILGTAAYMSPEQARGRKLDKRSDFSGGVVCSRNRRSFVRRERWPNMWRPRMVRSSGEMENRVTGRSAGGDSMRTVAPIPARRPAMPATQASRRPPLRSGSTARPRSRVASASSISLRTSPMSRRRFFRSFSTHRRRSLSMRGSSASGSAAQSGSSLMTEAKMSETSSPEKAFFPLSIS